MMKRMTKTAALGLALALATATLGGITPSKTVTLAKEVSTTEAKQGSQPWMIDGEWIPAEDTTVNESIQKMIMEPFLHMVGSARRAVMYLGSQTTNSGTNHCVLVSSNPIVPNPVFSYALYYIHENSDGEYETYHTKMLDESEYADYSVIKYVKLNKTSIKIKKGQKAKLKASYFPKTDEPVTLEWTSSDKKIATVKNGVIKAKKKGTCLIYCKIKGVAESNTYCIVNVKRSTSKKTA